MEIKFKLTLDDYVDFNLYHMKHSKSMKEILILLKYMFPLVLAVCGCILYYLLGNSEKVIVYFFIILCAIVYILIFSKIYEKEIRKGIIKLVNEGNTEDLLGEQSISLKEEYLENTSVGGCEQLKYNMIERIEMDEKCMYIYKNAIAACVIPFSAFSNQEEKDKFINQLKEKTNML